MTPSVSVIVATRNRRQLLAQTLEALSRQTGLARGFEIVVADNGSTDDTSAVVTETARASGAAVVYLSVATPGKSHAVNAALAVARGDLLAFTDDDVRPEPEWLARLVEALERPGVDFVAGRVLPTWETIPPAWMSPALYGVLAIPDNGTTPMDITSLSSGVMPIGANMAVNRRVVDRIGGLRVDLGKLEGTLRTGEDHEFFLRMLGAGFHGRYEPRALVHHWVPAERLEREYFQRWLFQNGRDVARLESSYPSASHRLLGVPRYRWSEAASDLIAWVRSTAGRDDARRFAAGGRLRWLIGYLRESWLGGAGLPAAG
jgi:glycosyltransferase involved in cell wall biosynthesis